MRLSLPAALVAAVVLQGCIGDSVSDEISTEVTIDLATSPGQIVEVRKRFRFSHDPRDARGVYFSDARLQLLSPVDADLSYLHRVDVLVVDPASPEVSVLVGRAEGFLPGDRVVPFDVIYTDDLRRFASDDSRVTFSFALETNTWSGGLPEGGLTVAATATIQIDI
ncbi:MAG: hypothetical protein H6700_08625 [Myxococcales bacterium]|nr:hypothetical protein [Myxococcales bacterium]MCB9520088.1 hypothetical protein [Myxococcales bacterium]MCB9531814.1 hypothetical protein [Myxococcales bacterium]